MDGGENTGALDRMQVVPKGARYLFDMHPKAALTIYQDAI